MNSMFIGNHEEFIKEKIPSILLGKNKGDKLSKFKLEEYQEVQDRLSGLYQLNNLMKAD